MPRKFDDVFRPVYETAAMASWSGATVGLLACRPVFWPAFAIGTIGFAYLRGRQAFDLYRFKAAITTTLIENISVKELMRRCSKKLLQTKTDNSALWMGKGFRWTQKHAQLSRTIMRRDTQEIKGLPDWMPPQLKDTFRPENFFPPKEDSIGEPWIHGLSPDEEDLYLPIDVLTGHTLIVGTTRAGKTRLYELISTQIVARKKVLIVVDPKGDKDWEKRLRQECERNKRKFLYFHPAHPEKSIRLNPLANWNNISEPATRLQQNVDAEGTFGAFAWKTLYRIIRGMDADGCMPKITSVKEYVQAGIEPLLERLIERTLVGLQGAKWDSDLSAYSLKKDSKVGTQIKSEKLYQMVEKFNSLGINDEVISSLIAMATHSKEHYSKMIQVLEPILEMLGSGEIGKMLSPDELDLNDTREIWDTERIVKEEAVLYLALDTLPDKTIGQAIGSIFLSNFASHAGFMYNNDQKKEIYLMVDEAAEVMNDPTIQILNKAGGAGIRAFIATQTIADFEAVFGSQAKTRQALGNLNNVISLRVKDMQMAEWIADSFGTTSAINISESFSSGSGSTKNFTEFTASSSQSMSEVDAPFVSKDLLTRLPPLQFFAFIAGSKLYKGRIPALN